ncbi:MAG: phosphoribosylglycinamide formyltransferase [candidate division WOR-3 bacterium]
MVEKKNIAVLASGRGTNFEALARACQQSDFPAVIKVLVVNVPGAPVLVRAEALGIPQVVIDHRQFRKRQDFEAEVIRVLDANNIQLICLAGFNRILTRYFLERFPMRIMNIHPSLLPAFAGLQGLEVHRAVIEYGVKVTGCTVHFVTAELDAGPIIVQRAIPVRDVDTPESLAVRVLVEEHQAYPEAVRLFCEDRLEVVGRRVRLRS